MAQPLPEASDAWHGRSAAAVCAVAWVGCMLACMLVTHLADYHVHDADSRLYAAMAQDLAQRPMRQWCAPGWQGHWGREGLFYEHPPGLLWAGAALVRLGCAPEQALYVCNFLALFASLTLLGAIARTLAMRRSERQAPPGRAVRHVPKEYAGWDAALMAMALWMATPAFLQYLVRGNQEHPLGLAVLLGLYALVCHGSPAFVGVTWMLALLLGLAVKGIPVAALLPVAALYLLRHDRTRARAGALALGCVGAGMAAWAYDGWAQQVTGASFWEHYLAGQVQHSVGGGGLQRKVGNLFYYAARPLWFGLPAVVLLAAGASRWRGRDKRLSVALELGLGVALIFVAGFSLADRKADRYIFPIYPALALAAADLVMRRPRWRAHVGRWRHALPYCFMVFLLIAVGVKIYMGTHHYRHIRLWPGA